MAVQLDPPPGRCAGSAMLKYGRELPRFTRLLIGRRLGRLMPAIRPEVEPKRAPAAPVLQSQLTLNTGPAPIRTRAM